MNEDVLNDMVEVTLNDPEDFLKVRETLTRIGIASIERQEGGNKWLYQSCHILHKRERYYIVHFKEMFALDGKESTLTQEDTQRRNRIVALLQEWGLISVTDPDKIEDQSKMSAIKVVPYREKNEWNLVPKYNIGSRGK